MNRARVLTVLIIGIVLIGIVFVLLSLSKPKIQVEITAEKHNPLTTQVRIDGRVIVPSGPEGRLYKTSTGSGTVNITITGPFLKSVQTDVALSLFDNKTIEVPLEAESAENIIASTVGDDGEIRISNMKVFQKDSVIVGFVEINGVATEDSYPSIFYYDTESRVWSDITEGYFLNRNNYMLSEQVKSYIGELSND